MIRCPPKALHHLSEVISENISDKNRSMVTGLLNDILFVDNSAAMDASDSGSIINIADFGPTVYGEIVVAAWALKRNVTHH